MHHLCHTKNHAEIVYDANHSHVATHFEDTPALKPAVIEALTNIAVSGDKMFFEYDLDHVIGTTDLVETTDQDEIVYAKRKHRDVYTHFTKSQQPRDCSTVTIALEKQDDYKYLLWSAWIGYKGPVFPGSDDETPDSKPYWQAHALVWGRQEIQAGTETAVSPWDD